MEIAEEKAVVWEYKCVACLQSIEAIGQGLDVMGAKGWEYVDHFDGTIAVPEPPPDLRGGQSPHRDLSLARNGANKTAPCHYLIFKRLAGNAAEPCET